MYDEERCCVLLGTAACHTRPCATASNILEVPELFRRRTARHHEHASLARPQVARYGDYSCRVGSVFFLGKETNGTFSTVPGLSGRHISFISGGYDKILVAVSSPTAVHASRPRRCHSTQQHRESGSHTNIDMKQAHGICDPVQANCFVEDSYFDASRLIPVRPSNSSRLRSQTSVPPPQPRQQCGSRVSDPLILGKRQHRSQEAEIHHSNRAVCLHQRGGEQSPTRRLPHSRCQDQPSQATCEAGNLSFNQVVVAAFAGSKFGRDRVVWACPGRHHFLILTSSGRLYSSGDSPYGCMGQGGLACSGAPLAIPALRHARVTQACVGESYSLALTADGGVYSWGGGFHGQLGRAPEEVSLIPRFLQRLMRIPINAIACNESHVIAITRDGGRCLAWGSNDCGQLGLGRRCPTQHTPQFVEITKGENASICNEGQPALNHNLEPFDNVSSAKQTAERAGPSHACTHSAREFVMVSGIAAGWRHSLALSVEGDVYAWGLNACGQLGLGHRGRTDVPTIVSDFPPQHLELWSSPYLPTSQKRIVSVSESSAFAPKAGGGHERPFRPKVHQISAGRLFSAFLLEDGRVLVSGRIPSGKEEATREKITRNHLRVTERSRKEIQACLTPSK
ncbi:RCC1 domain containing protein [Besnoitia besnoiti]|uniref:RCC1 domain containing protein n=1 Tax=Besnoitia besnoiti TaxID=94643 RepID=A0A2A9M0S4_BESBE|nr:RCC1 domain containing protein [Besnoitia besnoiti]PFH31575.1 RCC1 domain containing protein [Besnoitia besnoiti]